jgi:translation initiation factor IF-2
MNNIKVRIYDLSRELNLDNKDILNICEQLHIAVKSHSSTISESDADRIREAAQKAAGKLRKRPIAEKNDPRNKLTPSPILEKKPQIVEVRLRKDIDPKNRPQSSSTPTAPELKPQINPPNRLESLPANLPEQSAALESPVESLPSNQPNPVAESPPTQPTQSAQPEQLSGQNGQGEKTALPPNPPVSQVLSHPDPQPNHQAVEEPKQPSPSNHQPEKLAPPPTLNAPEIPVLEAPPRERSTPSNNFERPVLKRKGGEEIKPKTSEAKPRAGEKLSPNRPNRGEGEAAKVTRPVLELQRPQRRPQPSEADPVAAKIGGEPVPSLNLKRPLPPKMVSKKKQWEEEEEEKENAKKTKAKRRLQDAFEEDDDDDLDDLEDGDAPMVVSLSVARPPRPKQENSSPNAPIAVATKKKPTLKTDRKAEPRERRQDKKNDQPAEFVTLSGSLTVRDLSAMINVPETEIIKNLFFKGIAISITQTLELDTAKMVAEEFGVIVDMAVVTAPATKVTEMIEVSDLESLQRRPPVVTIMGHVDHGKTTLLDAIRSTKVAQGEAGGITQHIGAYHVDVEHEGKMQQVVFLDTPGHEAFTAMRARGTRVTDIAILVVAADDGVQPQTIEAISHAKAAGVPIIVAINKVDKVGAQPDRVKQELTDRGLQPEEWGGDTIMVPVSAIKGENLDTLLEMILLVADVEELVANPERLAKGTVIEANLDKNKGPVATLLIQNGTLRLGDSLVAGSVFGKVRAMVDDRGEPVKDAGPSFAVELLGLSDVPAAGDEFEVFESEKDARAIADQRGETQRETRLQQQMASRRVTLNSLSAKAAEGELKELNLILKADVQGSVEAILGSIQQLPQNEVQIRVLLATAGEITQTDIDLAAASGAVVIGFNTSPVGSARQAIEQLGVDVREYNIIYKLLDDIQGAMEGLLEPEQVEETLGQAEVRAIFTVGRNAVAGCYVLSGKVARNCSVRVRRGNQLVYEGNLDSLKRMKEDAKEVNTGYECGIGIDRFNDWAVGDTIDAFRMVAKRRTLSPN